jgi:TPR repeat protein
MIYQGLGVKANPTKAFLFYLKAAKKGLANAQYNAALMLSLGEGVEKDEEQSLFWYKEAAEQGYDKTQ